MCVAGLRTKRTSRTGQMAERRTADGGCVSRAELRPDTCGNFAVIPSENAEKGLALATAGDPEWLLSGEDPERRRAALKEGCCKVIARTARAELYNMSAGPTSHCGGSPASVKEAQLPGTLLIHQVGIDHQMNLPRPEQNSKLAVQHASCEITHVSPKAMSDMMLVQRQQHKSKKRFRK